MNERDKKFLITEVAIPWAISTLTLLGTALGKYLALLKGEESK